MGALITAVEYNVSPNLGGKMIKFEFVSTAGSDWVVFDEPIGTCYSSLPTGGVNTCAYPTLKVDDGSGWTATDTTLHYDDVTAATELKSTDGYIMMGNEIIHYTAGGASTEDDFTGCSRGCFGTTAAIHADSLDGYILNTLIFACGTTGLIRGVADVIGE